MSRAITAYVFRSFHIFTICSLFNINFELIPVLNLQADVLFLFAIKGDDA